MLTEERKKEERKKKLEGCLSLYIETDPAGHCFLSIILLICIDGVLMRSHQNETLFSSK